VVLALILGVAVWVDLRLHRVDALTDYAGRPAATPGADWLIVGSDSREGLTPAQRRRLGTGDAAGRRTDTMMLLHIPRGRSCWPGPSSRSPASASTTTWRSASTGSPRWWTRPAACGSA
jgi:hypothetical protein